jgi:hypothetical protein
MVKIHTEKVKNWVDAWCFRSTCEKTAQKDLVSSTLSIHNM